MCDILKYGGNYTSYNITDVDVHPGASFDFSVGSQPPTDTSIASWLINPSYTTTDKSGNLISTKNNFTIYSKDLGRFLQDNNGVVSTQYGLNNSQIWLFINISNKNPVSEITEGDYYIQNNVSQKYLNLNNTKSYTSVVPTIWTLKKIDDDLIDVYILFNKDMNKYLMPNGASLNYLKRNYAGYLPAFLFNTSAGYPTFKNNFYCQNGYDKFYNYVFNPSDQDPIITDCCGNKTPINTFIQNMNNKYNSKKSIDNWKNSLNNYPCIPKIDYIVKVGGTETTVTGRNINNTSFSENVPFSYTIPSTNYSNCETNWKNVFNGDEAENRFPCEPYAWFPDPADPTATNFRQIPIPTEVYNKCLENQKNYVRTVQDKNCGGTPNCKVCATTVTATGKNGYKTTDFSPPPEIDVSAYDFCVCTCNNFLNNEENCENICNSDPSLNNYKNAEDVWNNGWYFNSNSKICKQSTPNTLNGEFLSESGCNQIVNNSPVQPPKPSPGPGPSPGPSVPSGVSKWYTYGIIGFLLLLLILGIIIDIRRMSKN